MVSEATNPLFITETINGNFGTIDGVGTAWRVLNVTGAGGKISVGEEHRFIKESDWSGDAAEEVEVL